jgi:hypothetical protein
MEMGGREEILLKKDIIVLIILEPFLASIATILIYSSLVWDRLWLIFILT